MTSASGALRAIADHLDRHLEREGRVNVIITGRKPADILAIVLDGATEGDISVRDTGTMHPVVERDFGSARLVTHVPRGMVAEARTTVTDEVLTAAELVARHRQQRLDMEAGQ